MNAFRAYFACAKISFKLPFLGVLVDQSEFVFVVSVVPLAFGIWHLALGCELPWKWNVCPQHLSDTVLHRQLHANVKMNFYVCAWFFPFLQKIQNLHVLIQMREKKNNKSIYTAEITGLNTCSISIKRTIFFFSFIGSMDSIEFGKSQAIRLILLLMLCTA